MKNEKVLILGKSGSGKDFLLRNLIKKGLKGCVKYTTRPKREFEENGSSYNFVNESKFLELINNGEFLAYDKFEVTPKYSERQTWYYGITNEDFRNSQVFIITPSEFNKISKEDRKNCFVVYLDISKEIRESRLNNRNDSNDSIKRRIEADEMDFQNFTDYDLKVSDPDFNADDVYDLME